MPIKVECPGCGKTVKAASKYAGKFAKCPGCGVQVFFPLADVENAPPQFDFDQIIPPPPPTVVDCPYCSEEIKASAKKCRHCGEFLDEDLRREESEGESKTGWYHDKNEALKKKLGITDEGIKAVDNFGKGTMKLGVGLMGCGCLITILLPILIMMLGGLGILIGGE